MSVQMLSSEPVSFKKTPHVRLPFLDGMRGLAALDVVISHATNFAIGKPVSPILKIFVVIGSYGHYAVVEFIVLSGCCLMMPVMRSHELSVGHFSEYIKRRARRIIPPYYASLILTTIFIFLSVKNGLLPSDEFINIITPGILLSHLFLIHNLRLDWVYKINAPMWSVATEWQIYFLFPLMLLPIWKRFGSLVSIFSGLAVGLVPFYLLPTAKNFWWLSPWFPGLFAMGMAAAALIFTPKPHESIWRKLFSSGFTPVILFLFALILQKKHIVIPVWCSDMLMGVICASFITYCASLTIRKSEINKRPAVIHILESRWVMKLGAFSYSIYLTHSPVLSGMLRLFQGQATSIDRILTLELLIGMPVLIVIAYGFHCVFERPFLNTRPNSNSSSQSASSTI